MFKKFFTKEEKEAGVALKNFRKFSVFQKKYPVVEQLKLIGSPEYHLTSTEISSKIKQEKNRVEKARLEKVKEIVEIKEEMPVHAKALAAWKETDFLNAIGTATNKIRRFYVIAEATYFTIAAFFVGNLVPAFHNVLPIPDMLNTTAGKIIGAVVAAFCLVEGIIRRIAVKKWPIVVEKAVAKARNDYYGAVEMASSFEMADKLEQKQKHST